MSRLVSVTVTGLGHRLAVGLLFGAVAVTGACAPDEAPPTAGPEVLREGVDMVIIDMDHYLTRLGIRRARLLADTAEYVSENEIHLRPVELTFFDDEGREVSVLTANFGVFHEVSEDMEATGNVVVLDRRDDRRLETEQIRYTKEEDLLYGDRRFVMVSDGGRTTMRGEAFESDPGLDLVRTERPSGRSEPSVDTVRVAASDSATAEVPDSLTAAARATGVPDTAATTALDSVAVGDSTTADSTAATRDTASRDTTAIVPDSTAQDTTARDSTTSAKDGARASTGVG